MKPLNLNRAESWMNPKEVELAKRLSHDLNEFANDRGVLQTALLQLRINDLASTLIHVRRAEAHLDKVPTPFATLHAISKIREQLRRSIQDLEKYCDANGLPQNMGITDAMKPVLERVGPTLERLWQFEAD